MKHSVSFLLPARSVPIHLATLLMLLRLTMRSWVGWRITYHHHLAAALHRTLWAIEDVDKPTILKELYNYKETSEIRRRLNLATCEEKLRVFGTLDYVCLDWCLMATVWKFSDFVS